ncbi:unnamed protein product, partial [Brassica napus]
NLHGIHDKNNVGKVISQFSLNDPLSSSSLKEVGIRHVFHCDVTREEQNLCLLASSHDEEVHDADVWMATKIKGAGDM